MEYSDQILSSEEIVHAVYKLVINKTKEIRKFTCKIFNDEMFTRAITINIPEYIESVISNSECAIYCIKLEIPLLRCNYLFRIEKLIRLTNCFHLLNRFHLLVKNVDVEILYESLFNRTDANFVSMWLPKVLTKIIVDYCEFYWSFEESQDEDEFFKRMLGN